MNNFFKGSILYFFVLILILSGCSSQDSSGSQDGNSEKYPTKSIQLIVPWGAGGDTDAIFRLVAKGLEKQLDQTVVVKNVEGGSGTVGAQKALNADNDGYTLLAGHDSIAMSRLVGSADFGYFDFEPVALMTSTYDAVATSPENPWDNMEDVVKDANEHNGELSFAASLGSTSQLEPALIQTAADIKFNIIGYEGTAKRMKAVVGNHVDFGGVSVVAGKEYLKDDKMKLLGYLGPERSPILPDVPTLKEQGIDVVSATNRGVYAPKGTPESIVKKMSKALKKVANSQAFKDKMKSLGTDVNYKGYKEFSDFLNENQKNMKDALEKSGLSKQ
ncbi:tripartite tricarboxylate transporter substrate binding protein [Tuberibacillus sp. Marseille-P3662]|uniref:tripartite tricarboxylate transporter substrate binding protein n=1 Tax=Tuberibacillus sp. Marseille-P3662 TaxID=1965358 RepID=UPI000A1C9273|nr:tripartite tricarboxylate transporter substrate binding protein [Tuberibacillus sp. Marseille-P3662]